MSVFDLFADRYDLWYETPFGRSAYRLECECLRRVTPEFRMGLEVGVGTGRFASKLGVRFGVDISFSMVKRARERGIVPVVGDAGSLPFREGSFDLVLMVVTLCFLKDPLRALKEVRRVLKKGGGLVLGLILRESRWAEFYMEKAKKGHPIYREARFYSFGELEVMLKSAGFIIREVFSTLLEEPQDKNPVRNRAVVEGVSHLAGFTCVRAELL